MGATIPRGRQDGNAAQAQLHKLEVYTVFYVPIAILADLWTRKW